VLLRPEAAQLAADEQASPNLLHGRVLACSFRGSYCRLALRHETGVVLAFELDEARGRISDVGNQVKLYLRPEAINLLNQEEEEKV